MFACVASGVAPAAGPAPVSGPSSFTLTAGEAWFEQTPVMGSLCTFDFGDANGAYNALTGFNAAHIYETPGDYTLTIRREGVEPVSKTIHVQPNAWPVISLAAGASLIEVLGNLQAKTVVELARGATYDLPAPVEIRAREVEIRAAKGEGAPPRIRRVGRFSSSLIAKGLAITFRGLELDSDKVMSDPAIGDRKVGYRCISPDGAHTAVVDCTIRNVDDGIFCTPRTLGVLVQRCTFTDEVRGCDVWCDGNGITLLGNRMATSQREHNVRSSNPGFCNLMLFDNDLTSTRGKETLTFRVGQDLYASHNAFHKGWVRAGPGPHGDNTPMTPMELREHFVRHVVLEDNTLTDGAWFQLNEGSSDVTVRRNRVDATEGSVPVQLDGPNLTDVHVEDNHRVLKGTPTKKPFVRAQNVNPGDYVERGSKTKLHEQAPAVDDPPAQ